MANEPKDQLCVFRYLLLRKEVWFDQESQVVKRYNALITLGLEILQALLGQRHIVFIGRSEDLKLI